MFKPKEELQEMSVSEIALYINSLEEDQPEILGQTSYCVSYLNKVKSVLEEKGWHDFEEFYCLYRHTPKPHKEV